MSLPLFQAISDWAFGKIDCLEEEEKSVNWVNEIN